MNIAFTKEELVAKGGIVDSILQIRIVHDMTTYLYTQVFYTNVKGKFEHLTSY